jgi:hypothetical protein
MAKSDQTELWEWKPRPPDEVLLSARRLIAMHRAGLLGGEQMPEDANPALQPGSSDNYHYFTLPMALNYQRNSYSLWQAAKATYDDPSTRPVFSPTEAAKMSVKALATALVKYRVAIQPERHTETWRRICVSVKELLNGDIRNLFRDTRSSVPDILSFVCNEHKRCFPCLSGPKISNYWLYVVDQYTDARLVGKEALSIAPDTHAIQSTVQLGLVDPETASGQNAASAVSLAWRNLLAGTDILPIQVHTPLWLWSRAGFPRIVALPQEGH